MSGRLTVREDPAWAVFTSARWQIAEWPDVPIGLVSAHEQDRNNLHRNGITRYVPLYATVESALSELSDRCAAAATGGAAAPGIPAGRSSIRRCRELTAQWLTEWSRTDFIHVASLVATELVEAALSDTDSEFVLRLETDGSTVSVVVQHVGIANPVQRKSARRQSLRPRSGRREFVERGGATPPCPATPFGPSSVPENRF